MRKITIPRPDDWHLHLRDGAMLEGVIESSARHFARAIIMPNLVPPVTSVDAAAACASLPLSFAALFPAQNSAAHFHLHGLFLCGAGAAGGACSCTSACWALCCTAGE